MKLINVLPSPLSLFYATLVCSPLAIVVTIFKPPITTSTDGDFTIPPLQTTTAPAAATTAVGATVISTSVTTATKQKQNHHSAKEDDDDEQLFRQASRVNPKPSQPEKLAFMFLTTTPLPFAPLWELFFNQTPLNLYNIYIHADPAPSYDPPFSGVFLNRVIRNSKPTHRHSPTLISAARRLLSHALLEDPSNSMFALLSSSCIPLHSFNFTYKTLIWPKKSFIEILTNEPDAYDRWAVRGKHAMAPEVPFENFRIGSQFFVLTREHARMVVSDSKLWSKFKLPCLKKSICYPEEHYFPTLISMKDPGGCIPATLTHVDWSVRRHGHPRMYRASEVGPKLIATIRRKKPRYGDDGPNGSSSLATKRTDPFLFARKFSTGSIGPLLRIAPNVIFKD
ncbi:hypothetical protein NMG60_11028035 [Bertholletia excelsa]